MLQPAADVSNSSDTGEKTASPADPLTGTIQAEHVYQACFLHHRFS